MCNQQKKFTHIAQVFLNRTLAMFFQLELRCECNPFFPPHNTGSFLSLLFSKSHFIILTELSFLMPSFSSSHNEQWPRFQDQTYFFNHRFHLRAGSPKPRKSKIKRRKPLQWLSTFYDLSFPAANAPSKGSHLTLFQAMPLLRQPVLPVPLSQKKSSLWKISP